jgi:hypothetical protein
MAKDHGSSVKDDKQYEGLRNKGMSKSRAAAISNSEGSSSRGARAAAAEAAATVHRKRQLDARAERSQWLAGRASP